MTVGGCWLVTGYDCAYIRKNTDRDNGKIVVFGIDFATGIVEYDTVLNTGIRRGNENVVLLTTFQGMGARRISTL